MRTTDYNRSVLIVIAAGFFLSTLGIGTRMMESASGLSIVFYRAIGLGIAATLLLIFKNRNSVIRSFKISGWLGVISALFLSGASIFIVMAVVNTTVANAMFIVSLAPLFAGFLGWLILGERVRSKTWLAIVVALLGVFVLVQGALSTDGLLGIGYAFLMAICYGFFTVTLRYGREIDMLPAVCLSSYMLVVALGFGLDDLSITINDFIICIGLGVFQLGLGTYLLIVGSKHVPAAQLTLLAMLEVVLNPVWVWLGVGETPSISTLVGGAIILLAISYEALSSDGKFVK